MIYSKVEYFGLKSYLIFKVKTFKLIPRTIEHTTFCPCTKECVVKLVFLKTSVGDFVTELHF